MWNWLNCYLSGRHDFGVGCEPGAIFLRCIHCGKRSNGWALKGHQGPLTPAKARLPEQRTLVHVPPAMSFAPSGVARPKSA
jgi:hypothetical protein